MREEYDKLNQTILSSEYGKQSKNASKLGLPRGSTVRNVDDSELQESTDQEIIIHKKSEVRYKFGRRHQSIDAVKASSKNAKKLLIDDKKWRQRSIALGESAINFTPRNNSTKPFMSGGLKFSASPLNQESTFEFEKPTGMNTTR